MTTTELRLYIVALLAGVYAISWRAIGSPTPAPQPAAAPAPPHTVWLDDLPAGARPPVALPAGWQVASHAPSISTAPAPIRRTVHRVRTRSS